MMVNVKNKRARGRKTGVDFRMRMGVDGMEMVESRCRLEEGVSDD